MPQYDGIYATHQRSESDEILKSLDEIFRIAREAHIRAEISHLKLSGKANWGHTDQVIAAIEKARAEGLDITQDQYAYTASSTGISQLVPDAAKDGGTKNSSNVSMIPNKRKNHCANERRFKPSGKRQIMPMPSSLPTGTTNR